MRSLREHHPEAVLHLALIDSLPKDAGDLNEWIDEVTPIGSLDIPAWKSWAFCHDIVELSTAVKPFMLRHLLARPDCAKVFYLDPDTVVFSRLDDLLAALDAANIVLTPHQTQPEESVETIIDNEICSLRHGIYNLGFIGVTAQPEGMRFADWWSSRTYQFCRADIPNGLFTDQRWIDLAPAFFEGVAIARSGRHNVATWNLTTRHLTGSLREGFTVDGEPLGFYHFTGFGSGAHRIMAGRNARGKKAVFELINWYEAETSRLSREPHGEPRWSFGYFSNGEPIRPEHRVIYRLRPDLQQAYPDPFHAAGFLSWWEQQGSKDYPALFDGPNLATELAKLRSTIAPVFGQSAGYGWPKYKAMIEAALYDPATRRRLVRRAWEVLRTEGAGTITRKLGR